MKVHILLFSALLAVMAMVPLLSVPLRTGSPGAPAPAPAPNADAPSAVQQTPPAPLPAPETSEAAPPLSRAASMDDPVLLYDKATGQVVEMSQREYVLGAVCSEMPPSFHAEALKAQAVAAHSYLLRCRQQEQKSPNPALEGAYLQIDTSKREGYVSEAAAREMYGERFGLYYPAVRQAVQAVENEILLYGGQPIVAAYHAISAGRTEDAQNVWTGSAAYLVPVDSPGDRLAPDYETTVTFTEQEVDQRLRASYPAIELPEDKASWFEDVTRSASGYITQARIGGETISGQELRNLFELRSSDFTVDYQSGNYVFTVTGYGHGVGLSQYGADYMARQGADYRAILTHYYPGAELVRLS